MAGRTRSRGSLAFHGVVGGLIAGLAFAIADILVAVVFFGAPFYTPLRVIGTIINPAAFEASYPPIQASLLGLLVHAFFSAAYGLIFVYLVNLAGLISYPASIQVLLGSLYGLVLWVVNLLIIAPIGLPQYAILGPYVAGFTIAHFFYGLALGVYVARVKPGLSREVPGQ